MRESIDTLRIAGDSSVLSELFSRSNTWKLRRVLSDPARSFCVSISTIGPQTTAQLQTCQLEREKAWARIRSNTQRVLNYGPLEVQNRYGRGGRGGYRMVP